MPVLVRGHDHAIALNLVTERDRVMSAVVAADSRVGVVAADCHHQAVTESFARFVRDPRAISGLLDNYLGTAERLKAVRATTHRAPGNVAAQDLEWCQSATGEHAELATLVSASLLEAGRQHLRAIVLLMSADDVDQAIVASARACVEAGARVLALTDPDAEPVERFTCALNESWAILPRFKDRPTDAHQALRDLAASAGIAETSTWKGVKFGAKDRPTMTAALKNGLTAVGYREGEYLKFLTFWNAASHAGADAGLLTLAIRGGEGLALNFRGHAALAALTVFGTAHAQQSRYRGYPTVADGLSPDSNWN